MPDKRDIDLLRNFGISIATCQGNRRRQGYVECHQYFEYLGSFEAELWCREYKASVPVQLDALMIKLTASV